jgi:outer membrane receptor protein involved in Fe transport
MKRLQFCLVVFAVLALTFSAFAQVQNGQFTGTVTDPTGAAIGNAKIQVSNPAIDLNLYTTTNSSGYYTVKEVPPGVYKITVEAGGFKTVSNAGVTANVGTIAHVDFKMQIGKASEVVEVTGEAAAVNTEDSRLSTIVSAAQINSLPLNGRNVFDLMQMSTGAVNVMGVDFENGHSTVVNGLREDFNGFLINGISNKGLSGGVVNTPIEDTVEEFQQLGLNLSAQYGSSAGGTVNLVTKSGTNAWHGSGWEYIRNNALDANYFFNNHADPQVKRAPLHFNQFGLTFGGPIIKDKLFFFLSLQDDRFNTNAVPTTIQQESQVWRDAVTKGNTAFSATQGVTTGFNSTAALLYSVFPPSSKQGNPTGLTSDGYIANNGGSYSPFLCLDDTSALGPPLGFTRLQHQKLDYVFGVTPADVAAMQGKCTNIPALTPAGVGIDRKASIQETSVSSFGSQTQSLGNLFNGKEGSIRLDYNWNANNRMYVNFNYLRTTDKFGPCPTNSCTRGFLAPTRGLFPTGSLSFVHTFSPTVLNELRVGYTQNNLIDVVVGSGVPAVGFTDGTAGFGSYNGYPQAFKENIYTYSDMVSISHGNHNMKVGVDFRRNIENSEFNIARPSYYFYDQVGFAADAPYLQVNGVDPGICKAPCPVSSYNKNPQAQLSDNFRHWRNLEFGGYFQDDWKVSKRLTLNLGLRYDLYQRHHEEANYATTFIPGPGANLVQQIQNANVPAGTIGTIGGVQYNCTQPLVNLSLVPLVGSGCGPGGFAPSNSLGKGDHNNFGPRVGFAWDVFGDGKTSVRGGFGVSYEGTLYNPLSNSRWNLPYYSFDEILSGGVGQPGADTVYGPSVCGLGPPSAANCGQVSNVPVTFSGPPTNPNQGPAGQPQAQGNITGWDPTNPNFANLTGIVFQNGVRDPYVYNFHFGIQREILPKTVIDVKYVGTAGHKLFRAEDVNRQPGTRLPAGVVVTDNFGNQWTGMRGPVNPNGRLNANYLKLRAWENAVNSNYNSLQASVKRQMSHGLLFNVDYTYSHSIDNGSTWHSGATTANGSGAGEGYTTTNTDPGLDRGNSIYDIRHRLVVNYVYQLPGQNLKGAAGLILGGWAYNGIWAFQSGAHWEPTISSSSHLVGNCTQAGVNSGACENSGGDFNLDGGNNDRPNSTLSRIGSISHNSWANGWGQTVTKDSLGVKTYTYGSPGVTFTAPCLACVSNLGRNTFVGPGAWYADMTLSKIFKITEKVNMKFDANGFNVFNHTNFLLASAGGNANNNFTRGQFGQAKATLNPRELQFGVKISF